MKFEMTHLVWPGLQTPVFFTNTTAPDWLTSCNTIKGSTMDMRWFWTDHVLTLEIGEKVETDFRRIRRYE